MYNVIRQLRRCWLWAYRNAWRGQRSDGVSAESGGAGRPKSGKWGNGRRMDLWNLRNLCEVYSWRGAPIGLITPICPIPPIGGLLQAEGEGGVGVEAGG
jgi:hypothetical protein